MKRSTTALALLAAAATLALGAVAIPRPPQLSSETSGDTALVERVRTLVSETPGVRDRLSVAVIDGGSVSESGSGSDSDSDSGSDSDSVTIAHFGARDDTEYEIGSVTKTVTGSLLAIAVERGEVQPTTTLGELLDVGSSPAASITLRDLATHSSGLPRLPTTPGVILAGIVAGYRASDPYAGTSIDDLLDQARGAELGPKEYLYSNFGFALLGQALAVAADTDFETLARERVFEPSGMTRSSAPDRADDLATDAPTGFAASGRAADPWTMGADSPAGSVRSTLSDMVEYARGQLSGDAPGVAATEPIAPAGEEREVGYAWMTEADGVVWHNGGTGGFTSWVGFDRESGRAVVVLNGTAASVDDLGFALMEED